MFEISPGGTKVMHDREILAMIYCRVSDLTRPVRIRSACMNKSERVVTTVGAWPIASSECMSTLVVMAMCLSGLNSYASSKICAEGNSMS
jgi:hypothetical protein